MSASRITVGDESCDVRGFTNAHIQSAVDRLGPGGEVALSAGVFSMADALHLRNGVTVRGQGDQTILRKNPMKTALITTLIGYGHDDLIVDAPDTFEAGEGVIVSDDASGGFTDTTGTLMHRDDHTWFIDRLTVHDYDSRRHARVQTLFPLISAVGVQDATVEDLRLDGNSARNATMNGCRGGGFFAHFCKRIIARRIAVRDYNGEGFSFQTCDDLELDRCLADGCRGHGFHPGSGSNRFHIHDCVARNCGGGFFYCLRVRDSLFENSLLESNRGHGLNVWVRDTDNLNRNITIRGNGQCGICIIPGDRGRAPHRNTFEACTLEHNCASGGPAEIIVQGEVEGIRLVNNRIRRRPSVPGILVAPGTPPFISEGNLIEPAGPDAVVFQ